MRYTEIIALSALVASTSARPSLHSGPNARLHARDMKIKREVPQEQSHKKFLTKTQEMLLLDNPDEIVDSVFGLLGNAAASEGIGSIADAGKLNVGLNPKSLLISSRLPPASHCRPGFHQRCRCW
jgi:hypothetical protein